MEEESYRRMKGRRERRVQNLLDRVSQFVLKTLSRHDLQGARHA